MDPTSSSLPFGEQYQALSLLVQNCDKLTVLLTINHTMIVNWIYGHGHRYTELSKVIQRASIQIAAVYLPSPKGIVSTRIKELRTSLTRLLAAYHRLLYASNPQDDILRSISRDLKGPTIVDDEPDQGRHRTATRLAGSKLSCKYLLVLAIRIVEFEVEIFSKQISIENFRLIRQGWLNIVMRASINIPIERVTEEETFRRELLRLCQLTLLQCTADKIGILRKEEIIQSSDESYSRYKNESNSKTLLSRAMQLAFNALSWDHTDQYDRAVLQYTQVCRLLEKVLVGRHSQEDRKKIIDIRDACKDRINELQARMQTQKRWVAKRDRFDFSYFPKLHQKISTDLAPRTTISTRSFTETLEYQLLATIVDDLAEQIMPAMSLPEDFAELAVHILEVFAIKIQHISEKWSQTVATLVWKHRHAITRALETKFRKQNTNQQPLDDAVKDNKSVPKTSKSEKWQLWMENDDAMRFFEPKESIFDEEVTQNDSLSADDLKAVKNCLQYRWLVQRLQREHFLFTPGEDAMGQIAKELGNLFEVNPRTLVPKPTEVKLELRFDGNMLQNIFDARADLLVRGFSVDEVVTSEMLASALVITGTRNCLQAMSCGEYLDQVWPLEGRSVLGFIVSLDSKICQEMHLPSVKMEGLSTSLSQSFKLKGEPNAVIEIVQIIAWIYATFRKSPFEGGACFIPRINTIAPKVKKLSADVTANIQTAQQCIPTHQCMIDFSAQQLDSHSEQGECWLGALHRPILVGGYPILRRPPDCKGLEVSYGILMQVLGAQFITYYNNMLFVRAFSQMIYMTGQVGNVLQWHYISSDNPDISVSYYDLPENSSFSTKRRELEGSRHIVGWCSQAKCSVGAPDAIYDIGRSRLPGPSKTMLLESFTLNIGNIGGAQMPIRFAMNSPSLPSRPSGFVRKLLGLRDKFVLLWDEQDKRGWLIDGLSALLHLVRASLKCFNDDEISKSCFKLDIEKIQEPQGVYPDAAFHFFVDGQTIHDNMNLELYPDVDDQSPYLLRHQVDHLAELLQDVIDQQEKVCGYDGVKIKPHLRKHLQGWDFRDIAGTSGPFRPRETRLNTFGKAWVDLIRSINAVTLFGQGFGDLIKPTGLTCPQWTQVPCGQFYIAACTSTLRRVMEIHGDPSAMRLSESIIWYDPSSTLRQCNKNGPTHLLPDCTQMIWPKKLEKLIVRRATVPLDTGAMIFGHSTVFPRFWPDVGDPTEILREEEEEIDPDSSTDTTTSIESVMTSNSALSRSTNASSISSRTGSSKTSLTQRLRQVNLSKWKRKPGSA